MLKDIVINLLITGGIWKAHDLLTKPRRIPQRFPARRNTEADLEKCLTGCGAVVIIIFVFAMICIIGMAIADLPCFR